MLADRRRRSHKTGSKLAPWLIESLLPDLVGHDRKPSAFLVFLFLWHRMGGDPRASVSVSLSEIAEATGLSRASVQSAIRHLGRRQLLRSRRSAPTAIPTYRVGPPPHVDDEA